MKKVKYLTKPFGAFFLSRHVVAELAHDSKRKVSVSIQPSVSDRREIPFVDKRKFLEASVSSIQTIVENLRQLQKLDAQILKLMGGFEVSSDVKKTREELARIQSKERDGIRQSDELRLNRNQTQAGLDLCRQRILKTEIAIKECKGPEAFQVSSEALDQLKILEQSLEMKEAGIEREGQTILTQLAGFQSRRDVLEREMETQSKITRVKEQEISDGIREIEAKRNRFQDQIPAKDLSLYQRVAKARGGIGAVDVRGTSCSGCNMILPAQFVSELRRSKTIEQCPSCKRILLIATTE